MMDSAPKWQGLVVGYRPELKFYAQRIPILEGLGKLGLRKAWRYEENQIAALLNDAVELLTTRDSAVLNIGDPGFPREKAIEALRSVLSLLDARVVRVHLDSIHVLDTGLKEKDYDQLRHAASVALFPGFSSLVPVTDFSLLFDAEARSGQAKMQAEFGFVTAEEAASRLGGGTQGRLMPEGRPLRMLSEEVLGSLPQLGFYVQSRWVSTSKPESDLGAWVDDFWARHAKEAADFAEETMRLALSGPTAE